MQWYFVASGTPFVPYPNTFVSCNWDSDPKGRLVLGDQADLGRTWVNGARPPGIPLPPVRACGSAEQWLNGQELPAAIPVPLSADGVPLCCTPEGAFGVFPFQSSLWFVAEDIPGPQWASVGHWPNRLDALNPADQVEASLWPDKDYSLPLFQPAVELEGDEFLALTKPFGGLVWTLWLVWYPGDRGATAALTSAAGGPSITLGSASSLPFVNRLIAVSVGSLPVSPTVVVAGYQFVTPTIIRVSYDGTTLTLDCYGDVVGVASKVHVGQDYRFSYIGPGPGALVSSAAQWIGEILGWTRLLTSAEDAEVLAYLQGRYLDVIPPGSIWAYGGAVAPPGWLLCDGSAIDRSVFAALFAVLGTTYGPGDGATTFNVPDTRGRALAGEGTAGPDPLVRGTNAGAQYAGVPAGGNAAHLHTVPILSTSISTTPGTTSVQGVSNASTSNKNTSSNGTGNQFSVQNPVCVANYIVKT